MRRLAAKAREGRLSPDDLAGGTISITNIGAFGADPGTPIIQLPHVAIVGFGAITKEAVVVDDQIVIRPMILVSVTVDHRLVTGAVAAGFRVRLKELLDSPQRALLGMK
jgi:2-oxoglutarate dehydrogenase E2 component (dihydrolipoamide succinyltransferase)